MVISIVGLDFCVPELIWTIITFFVLMFLLKKFLYKPVLKILDERKAKVEAGLSEGKMAEAAFKETNAALNEELIEQNAKARELFEHARSEAEREKEAAVSAAHKKAETLRNELREQISAEENAAKSEVEDNMSELVMLLTNKLLDTGNAECSPELIKSCVEKSKDN